MNHPRFSVVELEFVGPATPIPADRVPLSVTFEHESAITVDVPGFWNGGDRYRVRFTPELEGSWVWRSVATDAELAGHTGDFTVGAAEPGQHGPVRVAGTFHFAHADGTPFRPVGTTAYNWLHQPEERFTETVESIAASGFNKFRFMVFAQAGGYVEHYPELLPFERDANGRHDVTRPNIAFFQKLDDAVEVLARAGIQADVLIYNAYDNGRFKLDELTAEEDAIYLQYLVARLSAYPNVWWSLCNEHDILDRPAERWEAAGVQLEQIDPHNHLRSIHNLVRFFDHNRPWITHASIQLGQATADFGRASLFRDAYSKPIVLDEIKYEGDIPERWGHLDARALVHQFWITTVSGCYASHGESFLTETGSLHMVEGGRLRGESPERLSFLRNILEAVDGVGLDPIDNWWDEAFVAGIAGAEYLQYLGTSAPASWSFRLPQSTMGDAARHSAGDRYAVDIIDTWNMTVTPVDGLFELDDVQRNEAFATRAQPIELPEGEALALRIRRIHSAA